MKSLTWGTGTHGRHGPQEPLLNAQAVPADICHHVRCDSKQEGDQLLCVLPQMQTSVGSLGYSTLIP